MAKGIRIGMDKIHYAIMTDEEQETYGTPKPIPGAITGTVSPTTNTETLYADDQTWETASSLGEIEIELNVADLTQEVLADLLGATVDANGVMVQAATDVAPYVALGFRSQKSNGKYRYYWFYKGKFQPNEEEFQTKEDSPSFQTPTITGTFISRQTDKMWRARVDEDGETVPAQVISNWFTAVYDGTPVP
ncbi:phage tail protein [Brevibacillus agri]|uniref:major tail protein n=1 Tax=Brevibacillus agri TaxID=51101 RepID=UPI002E1C7F2F|nr:major tail protein [Brevibacillus agri]MED1642266.1 phage tail protein [Brevibacillus agri]MED1652601.1 phage tail protein [Brevibacillus agri]MED1689645.1 phage tail protein [Brevibacillus agri]MED1691117.1 phage tail protein [Brevibacillus agri]MED1696773.1 phage tail protein [Brevibacillus agri]